MLEIEFDLAECKAALDATGLDLGRADELFAGTRPTIEADCQVYREDRFIMIGLLDGRVVILG